MSSKQDPTTCIICEKVIAGEVVSCPECKAEYHKACLVVNDNLEMWTCPKCDSGVLKVPGAPKSLRPRSHVSHASTSRKSAKSRSSTSSKAEMMLKALAEEKAIIDKQLYEQEQFMQQKHAKEMEFVARKKELLQQTFIDGGSISSSKNKVNLPMVPSITSKQKVKNWVAASAAHVEDDDTPKVNGDPPLNEGGAAAVDTDPEAKTTCDDKNHRSQMNAKLDASKGMDDNFKQQEDASKLQQTIPWMDANAVHSTHLNGHGALHSARSAHPNISPVNNLKGNQPTVNQTYLSQTRPKEYSVNILTREQIAARHVSKDLPEFDGTPKDWPRFISSYQRSTAVCGFSNSENLERLDRSLRGNAYAAVKSSITLEDNVPRILETLEMLFGRPEYIIDSLIEEMRSKKKPSMDSVGTIITYALDIENISTTMKLAKLFAHLTNPMLLNEMVVRLPYQLALEWAEISSDKPESNIETFSNWLRGKSMVYSLILKKPPTLTKAESLKPTERSKGFINLHDEKRETPKCLVCQLACKNVSECKVFAELNYFERWDVVKKSNLCRTCLKKHWGQCRKTQPCGVEKCPYFHHEMLHKTGEKDDNDPKTAEVNAHVSSYQGCVFKVVPVVISNGTQSVKTFAMLDDCSSLTLVSQAIANNLKASGPQEELCLRWTSNVKRVESNSQRLSLEIAGVGALGESPHRITCRTVANLNLPRQTLNYEQLSTEFQHLKGIPVESYENAEVGILIGMNNVKLLITKNYRTGNETEPIAAQTRLGWVVFGSSDRDSGNVFHVQQCDCSSSNERIDAMMKENYSIESLGISNATSSILPCEEQKAYKIWSQITKWKNNRYETGLLFKYENFKLPKSFHMAMRRLRCLQKKCDRELGLREVIDNQIKSYLEKGYARLVAAEEIHSYKEDLWYLPIFTVRNPNKPQKIRLVWDAAATVGETSLNSVLIKGPDLLSTLFGVLLRFRRYHIALSGDIQEMFHQIYIRPVDQRYQLFLWLDEHNNVVTFAMVGMTFGASCSPSTAQYIKNVNAEKYKNSHPRAFESIIQNHYVDDLLESVETEEEAVRLAQDVFKIHQSASFNIRNWISNSSAVMKALNSESGDSKSMQMTTDAPAEKVLGMWWKTSSDDFTFSLRYQKSSQEVWKGEKTPTKREVLRAVMSIYDPLGLLAHFLIFPKILLQSIWRESSGWDEQISPELAIQWKNWTTVLPKIEDLHIPRWIGLGKIASEAEIHVFTDASKEAYAAVVYIRLRHEDSKDFHVSLVSAKSRVAPLKYMSIPRLELMGALIGVRLAQNIKKELNIKISKTTYWTDSMCVLGWINSDHRKYRPYVAARIGEILESSTMNEWRYVPTEQNVADDATRMKIIEVSSKSRWFSGPVFLRKDESEWPIRVSKPKQETEEMLAQFTGVVGIHHAEIIAENVSSWITLRRIQVYVHRFINNMKVKIYGGLKIVGELMTAKELRQAENTLYRQAQEEGFPEEISILENPGSNIIPKSSSIYKEAPYLDEFGVMRGRGRIDAIAGVPFKTKRPVLLPKNHHITVVIMMFFHKLYHHQNSETVVNELRQRYVIPAMRTKLKNIKRNCQWCKNQAAKPGTVMMAGLPEARLTSFSRAFTCVGIDYFGPLFVAVKRTREKRWGILITCLTTRAVHLEVAQSLSTDSCILGLRRFMCRRGTPAIIYSDNATNFKGANNQLKEAMKNIDKEAMAIHFTSPDTEWSFIPPASPHMGGAWERMVRCVKTTLNVILPFKYTPNDELLLSVLLETENIVNSRPLTYIPLEDDVDEALTPNHFILGSSNGLKTFGTFNEGGFDLRNSWKQSQAYADIIWQKWMKSILPDLRKREKWLEDSKPIEIGDIALVIEEGVPRNCYKKAKVIGVNPGKDGKIRSVTIQTVDGIYVRPITKLAVLDVRDKLGKSSSGEHSIPSDDQGIPGGSVKNFTTEPKTDTAITSGRQLRNLPHRNSTE